MPDNGCSQAVPIIRRAMHDQYCTHSIAILPEKRKKCVKTQNYETKKQQQFSAVIVLKKPVEHFKGRKEKKIPGVIIFAGSGFNQNIFLRCRVFKVPRNSDPPETCKKNFLCLSSSWKLRGKKLGKAQEERNLRPPCRSNDCLG